MKFAVTVAPFIIFFLLRYLRATLKNFAPKPKWEKVLLISMYATVALAILDFFFGRGEGVWFWYAVEFIVMLISFKYDEFTHARRVMIGLIPISILLFISDLLEKLWGSFYNEVDNYIKLALAGAFTWMIAMFAMAKKQKKVLEKEIQQRRLEEEKMRFVEAQKIELEKQVADRTAELTQQKEELQHALVELKATQTQLIQSEKMASLGELTAGIAHEIQNPLNFVNNFSDLSTELVDEMEEAFKNNDQEEVMAIAGSIKENLQKIAHHGKRADAIVKGMLQHSRASTGKKEPTDINALADEYLRLSYHGLRAKDKSFNANFKTHFDATLGIVEVAGSEIGRVLLNLFTNAFYSVKEKKELQPTGYEPMVTVTTRKTFDKAEIRVKDNGMGISQKALDKIYQPFFTTKPTGQGTGLGLSMSYDIIKAHGGEIKVETKEGEGAEFIISIPL